MLQIEKYGYVCDAVWGSRWTVSFLFFYFLKKFLKIFILIFFQIKNILKNIFNHNFKHKEHVWECAVQTVLPKILNFFLFKIIFLKKKIILIYF
jgi:hypothetical protein